MTASRDAAAPSCSVLRTGVNIARETLGVIPLGQQSRMRDRKAVLVGDDPACAGWASRTSGPAIHGGCPRVAAERLHATPQDLEAGLRQHAVRSARGIRPFLNEIGVGDREVILGRGDSAGTGRAPPPPDSVSDAGRPFVLAAWRTASPPGFVPRAGCHARSIACVGPLRSDVRTLGRQVVRLRDRSASARGASFAVGSIDNLRSPAVAALLQAALPFGFVLRSSAYFIGVARVNPFGQKVRMCIGDRASRHLAKLGRQTSTDRRSTHALPEIGERFRLPASR